MKIVGVKPIYGGSLPVMEYTLSALHQLGHEITVVDFSPLQPIFQHIKMSKNCFQSFREKATKTIIETLYDVKPDVLFGIAQSPIFSPVIHFCKKHNIVTAFWFVEDFWRFEYWKKIVRFYDFFFVIQRDPLMGMIRRLGSRSFYLPLAADPSIHRPVSLSEEEKLEYGSSVSFVGAGYPNRVALFEKLEVDDFKLWGSDWTLPPWSKLHRALQRRGSRVSVEEYIKIFNASSINLNLHSSLIPNEIGLGDFVNPRTFEIASCRAFQIVDFRTLLCELFIEGEEIVVCRTLDEMNRLIKKALNDPSWREEIADRAYRRVLKEHTYLHRMLLFTKILEEQT
ncbi:MAG: glycosyltransferase [Deltaproteobacteria bacterium]|nr:glycosyltransferase [Deltaproteobacteria bacterium]